MEFKTVKEVPRIDVGSGLSAHSRMILDVVGSQPPGSILQISHDSPREANRTTNFLRGRKYTVNVRRCMVYVSIPA